MPAALIALPLPLGMSLLMLYAAVNLRRDHGAMALGVGAAFAATIAAAALTRDIWLPMLGDDASIIAALSLFFIAILAGVPVGFVLLLSTATYLWGTGTASLVVLPQTMVNGTGNFILLAVPFFILAGLVMERGGISIRLVRFIYALVGHMKRRPASGHGREHVCGLGTVRLEARRRRRRRHRHARRTRRTPRRGRRRRRARRSAR